ncbi:hypothetical protein KCP75_11655 [Salmonella enterica subsp. enterica]|nr:hypothetical protein KCP75_11655 [Salmonella enterica subsp. enterica]
MMEEQFKTSRKEQLIAAIGMFGSGSRTIWEGYAAAKLFKAGFRSNNIGPGERASLHGLGGGGLGAPRDKTGWAAIDIEQADAFGAVGFNMAEMHPIYGRASLTAA